MDQEHRPGCGVVCPIAGLLRGAPPPVPPRDTGWLVRNLWTVVLWLVPTAFLAITSWATTESTLGEHYPEMARLYQWVIGGCITAIVILGGFSIRNILGGIKEMRSDIKTLAAQNQTILLAMSHCTGCREAMDFVVGGRRRYDPPAAVGDGV